jgi:uncharacterized protein YxjI
MRYTTASKWSKEKFTIDDDEGKPQFEVVRVYGLDGNSLSLRDLGDNELAVICPRTGPTRFEVIAEGQPSITVRHKGWFGKRYCIDIPAGEMTATVGDFSRKSYEILSSGTVKANVTREFIRQQNLTIDLPDKGDAVSLVAVVLAIETLRDDRRQTESAIPFLRLALRVIN